MVVTKSYDINSFEDSVEMSGYNKTSVKRSFGYEEALELTGKLFILFTFIIIYIIYCKQQTYETLMTLL